SPPRLARERREERGAVDGEQNAQHGAEVAQLREAKRERLLIYTCAHCLPWIGSRNFSGPHRGRHRSSPPGYCGQVPPVRQAMSPRKPERKKPPARARSGRFGEPMSERMERFNASVDFDRRLAAVDIAASLAHARMLAATGIISAADLADIER